MKKSKSGKLAGMILSDLLLLAVLLLTFAYFHHVRVPIIKPEQLPQGVRTPAPTEAPTAPPSDATQDPAATGSGEPAAPGPTETPVPTGLLMGRFPEKFSENAAYTEDGYQSPQVSVKLLTSEQFDSVVHIADIYINDITSFRTAVFDEFGKHYLQTLDMSQQAGAIVSVSGDHFYQHLQSGVFAIRNGKLYSEKPNKKQDACVLYYDGAMEVYGPDEIDLDAIYARDPYQVWYFGPSLLDAEGTAIQKFSSTVAKANPRSAIGYYEPGHYCFVMVEGRFNNSEGVTLVELATIFEDLGCAAAYNLDGGKTSAMTFNGSLVSRLLGGGREVSDILYICEPGAPGAAE